MSLNGQLPSHTGSGWRRIRRAIKRDTARRARRLAKRYLDDVPRRVISRRPALMETVEVTIDGHYVGTLDGVISRDPAHAMAEAISVMDPFQNIEAWKEEEQYWN